MEKRGTDQTKMDSRNGPVPSPLPEKNKIAQTSPSVPSRFRGQLEAPFTPPKKNQAIRRAIYADDSNEIESSPLKISGCHCPPKKITHKNIIHLHVVMDHLLTHEGVYLHGRHRRLFQERIYNLSI